MTVTEGTLREIARSSTSHLDLWTRFVQASEVRCMAEIGVFRGGLTAAILRHCDGVARYYMVDPWRKLDQWNKPCNVSDEEFAPIFDDAMKKTAPWAEKRVVLRGKTSEVIDQIPDGTLDFVYIDGDHTLRGIAIDLIKCYPKVREGGWVGGDDFTTSIWQHRPSFEPTLVFPFAVYFAEAMDEQIFAISRDQFLIQKQRDESFEFRDLTGRYGAVDLRDQVAPRDGER